MKPASTAAITALLNSAVKAGVFPGAVAAWGRRGRPPLMAWAGRRGRSRQRTAVSRATVYDLASLTKLLATTVIIMHLTFGRRLDPLAPLTAAVPGRGWPEAWKSLTFGHLLSHQAGLPAWRPFYQQLASVPPPDRPAALLAAILAEPLAAGPGCRTVYSDLGFMLLGLLLEKITGETMGGLFQQVVAKPLGLQNQIGFTPLNWCPADRLAPTEDAPRQPGPLDYPGLSSQGEVPLGRVHDDNAGWLGGEAGHAGLFGDIQAVWQIMTVLIEGRAGLFDEKTALDFRRPRFPAAGGPARGWGFDLFAPWGGGPAQSGWPANTVGHLGYTGTSLWYDPDQHFGAVLLSNRVHPTAANPAIAGFRLVFQQAVRQNF